jgi:hypothetical protein
MKVENPKIKKLIHSLGLEFGLQDDIIQKIVQSPFKFTRETISNLDVKDNMTEEEFNELKTNFIYMHIGKLYTNFNVYNKIKKQKINLTEKWEKREKT